MYDYIFITNTVAFYKINLFNQLSKILKIKVYFISNKSIIRNDDFSRGNKEFEYEVINSEPYEERNKFKSFIKLAAFLRKEKFKKLVVPGWEIQELNFLLLFLTKEKNCMSIESSVMESATSGFKAAIKRVIVKRVCIAFTSGPLQRELMEKLNFKGNIIQTYGVGIINYSLPAIRRHKKITNRINYLYVGRLSPEKNIEFLIESFIRLDRQLTIVGEGPLYEVLQNKVRTIDNIELLGHIDNKKLDKVFNKSDIFVLPSLSEPWGLVVDEAISYGLPVIASENVGCVVPLIEEPRNGITFNPKSFKSLKRAIQDIEDNINLYVSNVEQFSIEKRDLNQLEAYIKVIESS